MNSWFQKPSPPNRRKAERRTSPGLAAYHCAGLFPRQHSIRDISAGGMYLLTEERWTPDQLISLTLQREGPLERNPRRRITVQARTVRWGEDGVGLSFILPAGMDVRLWGSPLKNAADQAEPEDILREFRMAEALAFLCRICPSATDDLALLLHEGLSNYRVESAVEIALKAKKMLQSEPDADKMQIPSHFVLRILENGSWADAEWMQIFWAGLLATSCTVEGNDESNQIFIDLFSQLAMMHARILEAACKRAIKVISGPDRVSSRPLICTANEMIKITGSHDLVRIDRDIEHLSDLGLLARRVRSSFFSPIDDTSITPTSLGLELYARCNGHRGTPQDFYNLVSLCTPALVT